MEQHEIVPDVIDVAPEGILQVEFGTVKVNLGNLVTIQEVEDQPTVISWESDPTKFYTLCFTDPDAPSRSEPTVREWVHWLVVNIPGDSRDLSQGEVLIEFVPSCPGKDTGLHRYTFLVYEQPMGRLDLESVQKTQQKLDKSVEHRALRRHFSIRNFAKAINLGEAKFVNFFQTQWDEYVNVVRAKLGLN